MPIFDEGPTTPGVDDSALRAEITRLQKIVKVLMDRAERSTNAQGSDFSLFLTTVMLEDQVRHRTEELEAALHENEKITRALRESESKFRNLVDQPLVGIAIIENGFFSYTNHKFADIFGYSQDEILKLGPLDVIYPSDRALVAEQLRKRLSGEVERVDYQFCGLRKDGEQVDIELHGSAMNISGKLVLISIALDITERARAERAVLVLQHQLIEQSTHDSLTGLYNRRYLDETLGRELIRANREGYPVSAIMSDLDHFKAVNDRYGHLGGDEVLRTFGALIKGQSRASDICCRYGGEEFLLILPGMAKAAAFERVEKLRSILESTSVMFGAVPITVTASFGVAMFPQDASTGDQLVGAADEELYAAKSNGRNQVRVRAT